MKTLVGIIVALTVSLWPATAAVGADDGTDVPVNANPQIWTYYVQNFAAQEAAQDWSTATGTLVADNGFRPFADGFSFFNTGVPDSSNHAMYGTPATGPKNLDARTMRSMIGKRVCVEREAKGRCTLTLAARQWMDVVNEGMSGGHCYGFAATASMFFNKTMRPSQFQSGAATTYSLDLRTKISREIARNFSTQYLTDASQYAVKPSQAVALLTKALRPGSSPLVLTMFSSAGGHAVTPYALYDQGNGQFDVAIYDNNYPDYQRVVRLDTAAEQAQYAFSVNPNTGASDPNLTEIGLIPVNAIAKKQPCPFCPGANDTVVQISPVKSDVRLGVKITDLKGKPIKGVERKAPTSPWEPGQRWNFPTFVVPKGKTFIVRLSAKRSRTAIRTSVSAVTGAYTLAAYRASVPAGGIGQVGLRPKAGVVVYASKDPRLGRLQFVDNVANSDATVIVARAKSKDDAAIVGALSQKTKQVVLFTVDDKKGTATAAAQHQYLHKGAVVTVDAKLKAKLPQGARVVLDYARWTPTKPRGLRAFLVVNDEATRVKVQFKVNRPKS